MSDQPNAQPPTVVNVHNTNYATAQASAAAAASASADPGGPKSTLVAYIALAVGFWGGLHRVYLRRRVGKWLAGFYLLPWAATMFTSGNPAVLLLPLAFLVIDAFSIPGWIRHHNARASQAGASARAEALPAPAATENPEAAEPSPSDMPRSAPKREDLRTLLLRAAHQGDGQLTVTQAVMETGQGFDQVEKQLQAMLRDGYIDVDNDPESGVVIYRFPELVGRPALRPGG